MELNGPLVVETEPDIGWCIHACCVDDWLAQVAAQICFVGSTMRSARLLDADLVNCVIPGPEPCPNQNHPAGSFPTCCADDPETLFVLKTNRRCTKPVPRVGAEWPIPQPRVGEVAIWCLCKLPYAVMLIGSMFHVTLKAESISI